MDDEVFKTSGNLKIGSPPGIIGVVFMMTSSLTIVMWDWFIMLPSEVSHMWRGQSVRVKLFYGFVRYAAIATMTTSFHVLGPFARPLDVKMCTDMAAIIHILGSATNMYATHELFSRLYAVWDDRKWILRTLKVAHAVSCAASSIFSLYFLRTLPGSVTPYVELIDRACVMHELPWAQHCVWACEMAFDLFLIIMTLVNAADRPLRVSVSVVQSLLERGSFVYFVMFLFRLGNLGFSTFYHPGYFIMIQMLSYSITSVLVIRLIINVERIMQQGKHVDGKDDNVKEGSVSPPQFDEQETYTV